jgi:hypothetical protein
MCIYILMKWTSTNLTKSSLLNVEDDHFGNTNKQTEILLSVKPDEVLLNQMWWSIDMVCTHDNNISLSDLSDDDDDMRWWRFDDVFTLRCTKEPPGMSAFIRPENLQICFKSGLCSFLALHSRVSNFFVPVWFVFWAN